MEMPISVTRFVQPLLKLKLLVTSAAAHIETWTLEKLQLHEHTSTTSFSPTRSQTLEARIEDL